MSIDIRLPNITAKDEKGQLQQIRSYLFQLAEQLNWALGTMDNKGAETVQSSNASANQKNAVEQSQATFSELKSLIIRSADIVDAYYEEINRRLEGVYVAQSDFGTYMQNTSLTINESSTSIGLIFENQQTLQSDMEGLQNTLILGANGTTILGAQAWCRIGVLGEDDSGFPTYGMEIGQTNSENGETVYKKFAQYRSDGVHLFDQNGTEVATISDSTLKVTNARIANANITGTLDMGGYTVSTNNGLVVKWGGR